MFGAVIKGCYHVFGAVMKGMVICVWCGDKRDATMCLVL